LDLQWILKRSRRPKLLLRQSRARRMREETARKNQRRENMILLKKKSILLKLKIQKRSTLITFPLTIKIMSRLIKRKIIMIKSLLISMINKLRILVNLIISQM